MCSAMDAELVCFIEWPIQSAAWALDEGLTAMRILTAGIGGGLLKSAIGTGDGGSGGWRVASGG